MRKIKAGIIGCGVIAPLHIECLQKQENVEVTWACDLEPEKAKEVAEKYNISNTCTDYSEILKDSEVDLICVCTDHASHYDISRQALDARKHVVCEKALATTTENISNFINAQKDYPKQVLCGIFQHRFDPPMQLLKELIDNNELGTILTASVTLYCVRTNEYYTSGNWRGTWAKEGGGVLINQAIHFIDLLAWITGGVKSLCGQHNNFTHQGVIEVEDTAVAALRFNNGAIGTLEATSSSHINWENTISIHGTEGSIELRDGNPLKVIFKDEAKTEKFNKAFETCHDERRISAGANHYGFGHAAQFADVISAIREERAPFVTMASACHANEIVLAVYESCKSGTWVDINSKI